MPPGRRPSRPPRREAELEVVAVWDKESSGRREPVEGRPGRALGGALALQDVLRRSVMRARTAGGARLHQARARSHLVLRGPRGLDVL